MGRCGKLGETLKNARTGGKEEEKKNNPRSKYSRKRVKKRQEKKTRTSTSAIAGARVYRIELFVAVVARTRQFSLMTAV